MYSYCFLQGYDVISFQINFILLIKQFFHMTKKSRQKFKYLESKKRLQDKINSIILHFETTFSSQKLSQTWECVFKNALFETHLSIEIISNKKSPPGNLEFHIQFISTEEMKNEVIGLEYKKSNVNGSIPANVLKSICNTFISYLTKIINERHTAGFRVKPFAFQYFHKWFILFYWKLLFMQLCWWQYVIYIEIVTRILLK